ncbi:diguanylate cyclase, partial [bacterium]|nr:diguanylate cyclase [bacterium]
MKALVFEDDPELSQSISAGLTRWGYEVIAANNVDAVYRALREEGAPQIAIVDCRHGFGLVKKIRKFAPGNVFVLAITSENRESNLLEAMEAGANDCLTKPFEEKVLEARLRAAQRVIELEQALTAKAAMDPLTHVCNRESIIQSLKKELERSKRNHAYLGLAMVDLDHFKKVNDTFGHLAGDTVLKRAVQTMLKSLRTYDVLGRYGGEEFLILLPGCDSSKVLAVAERMREQLARTKFSFAGHETTVTASVGVAVTKSGKFDPQLLIELADQALYRAKSSGRNRVESALSILEDSPESVMNLEAITERLQMEIEHRKKTEESLRESEERFQLISKATKDAIWDWDLITNQVWSSDGVQRLFGHPEGSGDRSQWSGRIHPEDADRVVRGIAFTIDAQKDFWTSEYRYRRANGTYANVLDRGYVLYDENGKAIRIIGAMIDLTEGKRSEILQSALYRISEAANSAQDMQQLYKTIHSIVGELMYAGNFYIALYDAQTKLISFPYWVDEVDPVAPDPVRAERGLTAYVIREGKPLFSTAEDWDEFQKSGDVELVGAYSLDWLGVPLISEEQTIGVVVVQSYTESSRFTEKDMDLLTFVSQHIAAALKRKNTEEDRKRAEEALRESEEKYRTLFETSKDPIFISTTEGKLIDINPAGVELFGYSSRKEMLQVNAAELFQDPAERVAYKEAIQAQGFLKDYELHLKRKDGHKITVLETASAIMNEKGAVIAYRGVMRDITNLKLLQQQLLQAQKIETVGRLAGGVAHDFNNLLMAITGYCELIDLKYGNDELLMEYMKEIKKATERGAGLTRQLLAFSRKQVVALVPIELDLLITNMDRMIDRMLGENISLILELHSDPSRILGDPGQIEQVIMNLVVNAKDAMSSGGVLTVETQDTELSAQVAEQHLGSKPGRYVLLKIADTGCGMDEATKSRIFEPFYSTKELGKGTGLGLATVYGIVHQMAGFIVVSSEQAKGTSFEIYFPRNVDPVAKESKVAARGVEPLHGHEVLLLVDDNDTVRAAVGAALSLYGYDVLQAGDGPEALQVAGNFDGEIHLLITDVVMPNMNGRQLAADLTAKWPTMKVLYMSGYADETFFESGRLEAGAYFLQKPVPAKTLL